MATAANRAEWLSEGTNSATSAASMMSVTMQPNTPKAMYRFRANKSTIAMAMMLIPRVKVSHAAG